MKGSFNTEYPHKNKDAFKPYLVAKLILSVKKPTNLPICL